MVRIVHASISENGTVNGVKGDSTGKEVCVRNWYSKPWWIMIRHPRKEIADRIAYVGERLARSNAVGYSQADRNSLHDTMKLFNHDVDAYLLHPVNTNTDCSAFVTECAIASGVQTLEYKGNAPTTSTMEKVFKKAGFEIYNQQRYLSSDKYLRRGDILLSPGYHTVIVIDDGETEKKPEKVSYFPPYTGKATSISYALDDMKVESTKSYRKKIYDANFTDKYEYTAYQNNEMLKKLKSGLLIMP